VAGGMSLEEAMESISDDTVRRQSV